MNEISNSHHQLSIGNVQGHFALLQKQDVTLHLSLITVVAFVATLIPGHYMYSIQFKN